MNIILKNIQIHTIVEMQKFHEENKSIKCAPSHEKIRKTIKLLIAKWKKRGFMVYKTEAVGASVW